MSTSKDFYIYQAGVFKNYNLLNSTGKTIFDALKQLNMKDFGYFDDYKYWDKVESIYVTSQQRGWGGVGHTTNKAIDITVSPTYMFPFVFAYIYRLTVFNCFISLHNKHIHIDSVLTSKNNHIKLAERKNNAGDIYTVPITENVAIEIINFYIPTYIDISHVLMPVNLTNAYKAKALELLREKVKINNVLDNLKDIRGEKPSYLDAFKGLALVIMGTGLIYFLYKKSQKKRLPNESRKFEDKETNRNIRA